LYELFEVFGLNSNQTTLAKVELIRQRLSELGLVLVPDVTSGELDSTRRVVFPDTDSITSELCTSELARGESETMEFKSSLLYDHKRAQAAPETPQNLLKSDAVIHSALKTIAGYLTKGGGVLFIGVDDNGKPIGIHHDFSCVSGDPSKQNADTWQLTLRTHIRDRFKDGQTVNNYVSCTLIELEGKLVARLEVAPRKAVSFLKEIKDYVLYERQGNQTVPVPIERFEEFLECRKSSVQ
jgi:hypothetical protein